MSNNPIKDFGKYSVTPKCLNQFQKKYQAYQGIVSSLFFYPKSTITCICREFEYVVKYPVFRVSHKKIIIKHRSSNWKNHRKTIDPDSWLKIIAPIAMVRNGQNHQHRIPATKKTSSSHCYQNWSLIALFYHVDRIRKNYILDLSPQVFNPKTTPEVGSFRGFPPLFHLETKHQKVTMGLPVKFTKNDEYWANLQSQKNSTRNWVASGKYNLLTHQQTARVQC